MINKWIALAFVSVSLVASVSSAQVLNFTNDPDPLKSQAGVAAFRGDRPSPKFPAGSAVWGVVFVSPQMVNIGNFSTGRINTAPASAQPLKMEVSLLNELGNFDPIYTVAVQLQDPASDHVVFPVLPDDYDASFPGMESLLHRVDNHRKGVPLQFKVRVESADPNFFAQNGFILDDTKGLGRMQVWLDRQHAAQKKIDDLEIPGRTKAVRAYRSQRSDPKFDSDAKKWFRAHMAPTIALDDVRVCSELIIVRDPLGRPMEKQLCALYTYKSNHKCWVQMRRLSYRRVGADTYDKEVVDSTYADMHVDVGDQRFAGAREYEIGCK